MKVFLDTSSLFKLYHPENGTESIRNIFRINDVSDIYLSEIAIIEFASTVWKKVRTQQLKDEDAVLLEQIFRNDLGKYLFIPITQILTRNAANLVSRYGKSGLRTLDGIQLATAVQLKGEADLFVTSDNLLNDFFSKEDLPILQS